MVTGIRGTRMASTIAVLNLDHCAASSGNVTGSWDDRRMTVDLRLGTSREKEAFWGATFLPHKRCAPLQH